MSPDGFNGRMEAWENALPDRLNKPNNEAHLEQCACVQIATNITLWYCSDLGTKILARAGIACTVLSQSFWNIMHDMDSNIKLAYTSLYEPQVSGGHVLHLV